MIIFIINILIIFYEIIFTIFSTLYIYIKYIYTPSNLNSIFYEKSYKSANSFLRDYIFTLKYFLINLKYIILPVYNTYRIVVSKPNWFGLYGSSVFISFEKTNLKQFIDFLNCINFSLNFIVLPIPVFLVFCEEKLICTNIPKYLYRYTLRFKSIITRRCQNFDLYALKTYKYYNLLRNNTFYTNTFKINFDLFFLEFKKIYNCVLTTIYIFYLNNFPKKFFNKLINYNTVIIKSIIYVYIVYLIQYLIIIIILFRIIYYKIF